MIVQTEFAMIRSSNSNAHYWEQGLYPGWTSFSLFRLMPSGPNKGTGPEPHYHDADEVWFFVSGHGELQLDGHAYPFTPNTFVYTPMGVVHRFQSFSDYVAIAMVTPLERQKRPDHLLVEVAGPPIPTVPGFVAPGAENSGPFPDPGPRCPFVEMRQLQLANTNTIEGARLLRNEHWCVANGRVQLQVDGMVAELAPGDIALLRAGAVRRLRSVGDSRVAVVRERA
jgi:mannose-6-phosphate isomerase-like protein (cupin superfamily)